MRIIAGSLKGRRLKTPRWEGLRPTSDKLRETLFNVLAPRLAGARVLDLYAGTGALGLEAISRGAAFTCFVEQDRRAQALILENARLCGVEERCAIIRANVARGLRELRDGRILSPFDPFDIILLDPPYGVDPAVALDGVDTVLAADGLVVLERAKRTPAPEAAGRLIKQRDLASGDSALSLYRVPLD